MPESKTFLQAPFITKFIALVLGATCLGLTVNRTYAVGDKGNVMFATHYGFFIVACILVLSYILDSPIQGKLMLIIGISAGVMYLTAGALYLESYDKKYKDDKILAAGIISLICAAAYFVDAYITWKY